MAPKAVIELGINQLTGGAISRSTEPKAPRSSNWLDNLSSELRDFFGDIEKNITSAITHGVDDFVDEAAAEAKSRFNVSDWYSLHVLSTCQGNYTPNATVSKPGRHTTSCNGDVRRKFPRTLRVRPRKLLMQSCFRSFQHCRDTGPAISDWYPKCEPRRP